MKRRQAAVEVDPMTAGTGYRAAHDEVRIGFAEQAVRSKRIEQGTLCDGKAALDDRFFGVGPDLIDDGAPAHEQSDRIDEDRFPGAGLTGQDLKARCELEAHLPDQREV